MPVLTWAFYCSTRGRGSSGASEWREEDFGDSVRDEVDRVKQCGNNYAR